MGLTEEDFADPIGDLAVNALRAALLLGAVNALRAALLLGALAVLLALSAVFSGCGPSSASNGIEAPACGVAAATTGGTIAYDLRATPAQVAKGTPYVAHFVEHWAPVAPAPFVVRVVQAGSLVVDGQHVSGVRELGSGRVWVSYQADGSVVAAEWEIPLEAQSQADPGSWTWGTWGPLYPGQSPANVALTSGP